MNYTPETVCSALSFALDADDQGCRLGSFENIFGYAYDTASRIEPRDTNARSNIREGRPASDTIAFACALVQLLADDTLAETEFTSVDRSKRLPVLGSIAQDLIARYFGAAR